MTEDKSEPPATQVDITWNEIVIDDRPHKPVEAPQAGERAPLPDDVRMKLSALLEALWRESADLERKACLRVVEEMASTIRGPARTLLDIAAKGIRKREK